jgi:copper chaperone NosL
MTGPARVALAGAGAVAALVAAVVLWPAPVAGPEAVAWGRDTCARCRMHLSQPGFAAQVSGPGGVARKFDDIGCLAAALADGEAAIADAWVEDHESGGFVPLVAAHLVRAAGVTTPMGHGIVAFADAAEAAAFAVAHDGTRVAVDQLAQEGMP